MDKKLGTLLIGLIFLVVIISGCTTNNSTNNSTNQNTNVNNTQHITKYFEVMGAAKRSGDTEIQVPVRKVTDQTIYFYYTPYKNGVPETGTWANVPQGIDTKQKFMLSLYGPDMTKYDSFDILACQDENGNIVLQKEHVTL